MKIDLSLELDDISKGGYDNHPRQRADYARHLAVMQAVRAVHNICDQLTLSVEEEQWAVALVGQKLVEELAGRYAVAALQVYLTKASAGTGG